jgi:hypothetical protein
MAEFIKARLRRTIKNLLVTLLMQLPYSRSVPLERWIYRLWPGFREA